MYYLLLESPMILMLSKVIYTNLRCIFIDRFKKNTVLRSFYFTFVYHSCNVILQCIFISTFILCYFISFSEIWVTLVLYLIVLIIVPVFHFNFLKMLDKRDYDLYMGENARLPSFHMVETDSASAAAGRTPSENSRLSGISPS